MLGRRWMEWELERAWREEVRRRRVRRRERERERVREMRRRDCVICMRHAEERRWRMEIERERERDRGWKIGRKMSV